MACRQQIACGHLQSDLWPCQAQVERQSKLSGTSSAPCCFFWVKQGLRLFLGYMSQARAWRGRREEEEGCLGPNESFLKLLFIINLQSGNA